MFLYITYVIEVQIRVEKKIQTEVNILETEPFLYLRN